MSEPLTPAEVAVLVDTIREQRAEIARLRTNQPLLEVLREIALDPSVPHNVRLKAAEVGVGYETPKLSATVAMTGSMENFGDRLDRANARVRQQRIEASGLHVVEGEGA